MKQVLDIINQVIKNLYKQEIVVKLERPKAEFGDYATNVAMQLAKSLGKNPRQIAEEIAVELRQQDLFSAVEVAGPGFINLRLNNQSLWQASQARAEQIYAGQNYVLEYSCPNAFKELHTGHLYQTIYGDMLARVLEAAGATLHRTSFGGDVGLHVAKCLWGMRNTIGEHYTYRSSPVSCIMMCSYKFTRRSLELLEKIGDSPFDRARWVSECYVKGAQAYEKYEKAKAEIIELNKKIYSIHARNDHRSFLAQVYWTTRQWSFDYFAAFYDLIKVDNMHYYPESSTAPVGMAVVKEQLTKGNLEESDGAVVFRGDEAKHLHTRVFITSNGLPTYETKDIGVIWKEKADYDFDHRILITGNDQREYMRVVYAAADVFQPGLGTQMTHLTNGTVKFSDGQKMSSRLGNVSRAVEVLDEIKTRVSGLSDKAELRDEIALGAIKYAFAKYRLGGDIAFDIEETVSLQGNSGPYIQYAHARACNILTKAQVQAQFDENCQADERSLLQKMSEFPEVITHAAREYMVHGICNYLYELAQEFNRFYEHNRVIGDEREATRLALVAGYRDILAAGLRILGIAAPERM